MQKSKTNMVEHLRGKSGSVSHRQHKGAFVVTAASTAARDVSFKGTRDVRKLETGHEALDKVWSKIPERKHHHG